MAEDKMTLLSEEFENDKTGERVSGITIIVDGKLKAIMDVLIAKNDKYQDYTEVVRDAIFNGINVLIQETK